MSYEVKQTNGGYIIHSESERYFLGRTIRSGKNYADYFLKQLKPSNEFITGLFFSSKRNEYYGTAMDGSRIVVKFRAGMAEILKKPS